MSSSGDPGDEWVLTGEHDSSELAKKLLDLHRHELIEGETRALVARPWLDKLLKKAGLEDLTSKGSAVPQDDVEVGPVDNSSIQAESNPSACMIGIAEGAHYTICTLDMWNYLKETYGLVSPEHEMLRKVIVKGLRQTTKLDVYPLFLKVVQVQDDGEPDFDKATYVALPSRSTTFEAYLNSLEGLKEEKQNKPNEDTKVALEDRVDDDMQYRLWIGKAKPSKEDSSKPPLVSSVTDGVAADDDAVLTDVFAEAADKAETVKAEKETSKKDDTKWVVLTKEDLETSIEKVAPPEGKGVMTVLVEKRKDDGEWKRATVTKDWKDFEVGDRLDAMDTVNKWLAAEVKEVKDTEIFIHYINWATKWDVWMSRDSDRIAPKGTKVTTSAFSSLGSSSLYGLGSLSLGGGWGGTSEEGSPPELGVVGLRNLGNTCFMNSTLQCLSNTRLLTDFFLEEDYTSLINRDNPLGWSGKVADEYGKWVKEMWGGQYKVVAPRSFKSAIGGFKEQFAGYAQQDSQELLSFLIDGLHEDLNQIKKKPATSAVESNGREDEVVAPEAWDVYKQRNESVIVDLFDGQLRSRIDCPECERVSVTFDSYNIMMVPMPTSSDHNLTVRVVYDDQTKPVTEVTVKVNKRGYMEELKASVGKIANVDPSTFVVADVWMNRIYRFLQDGTNISEVGANDELYLYECPVLKTVKYRESLIFKVHLYDQRGMLPIGMPRVVVVPKNPDDIITNAELRARIVRLLNPRKVQNDDAASDKVPFNIVPLSLSTSRCANHAYNETCTCDLEDNDEKMNCGPESYYESRKNEGQIQYSVRWEDGAFDKMKDREVVKVKNPEEEGQMTKKDVLTLYDCIGKFVEKEELTEENAVYCRECKTHTKQTKKLDVWSTPDILVILLKRFQHSRTARDKLDTYVDFPITGLDMSPFTKSKASDGKCMYDLYAVSNHMGGLGGGHYTAYAQNPINKTWYLFDDRSVSEVEPSRVVSRSAYVLFYQRRKTSPKSKKED